MKKDDFVGLVLLLIILDILLFGYVLIDWLGPDQFIILADGGRRLVTFNDELFVFKGVALTFDAFVSACFVGIPLIQNRVTLGRWL